jgi:hypothetical protein
MKKASGVEKHFSAGKLFHILLYSLNFEVLTRSTSAGFSHSLLFHPEDGGNLFFKISGSLQTTLPGNQGDSTLHNRCCENLRSNE